MTNNIEITLLLTKRSMVKSASLDAMVSVGRVGYAVVAGENNTTTIKVNYPEEYSGFSRYVYMKNSLGEYSILEFNSSLNSLTFTLPSSMTYFGNTSLTFYAKSANATAVWLPAIIPIEATGVDYKSIAIANMDVLNNVLTEVRASTNTANSAKVASDKASADVVELTKEVVDKRATKVYVGGVLRSEVRVFRQEGKPGDAEWGVGDVWERIVGRVE